MATRFYLPSNTETPDGVTPAFGSGWEDTASAVRGPLSLARTGRSSTDRTVTETSTVDNEDFLICQYVSHPLAAQSITGNWTAVLRAVESSTNLNASLQLIVRVVSGDGSIQRGIVYAGHTITTAVATAGALGQEFPTGTSATRIIPSTAGSSVSAQSGDRLVVEIGFRAQNTSATSMSATVTVGDDQAGDYPLAAGTTTTSSNPWVETDQNLTWLTPKAASLVDLFDSYDSAKWPFRNDGAAYSGGTLVLTPPAGDNAALNTEVAAHHVRYDLTGSQVTVELVGVPTGSTYGVALVVAREGTPDNRIFFLQEGSDVIFRYNVDGSGSDAGDTYDPVAHRWWRIRHDGTDVLWETSPDGVTWTTQRAETSAWDASWVYLALESTGGAGPVSGSAIFDNFNATVADTASVGVAAYGASVAADPNAGPAIVIAAVGGQVVAVSANAGQADVGVAAPGPALTLTANAGQADVGLTCYGAATSAVVVAGSADAVAAADAAVSAVAVNAADAAVGVTAGMPGLTLTSTAVAGQAAAAVDVPSAILEVTASAGIGDGDTYDDDYTDDYLGGTVTARAYNTTVAVGINAAAGAAAVTADIPGSAVSVAANAEVALVSTAGTGPGVTAVGTAAAGVAVAAADGQPPVVNTSSNASAAAGVAAVAVEAHTAAQSATVGAGMSQVAAGAHDPTAVPSVDATAVPAEVGVSAGNATEAVTLPAGTADVTADAPQPPLDVFAATATAESVADAFAPTAETVTFAVADAGVAVVEAAGGDALAAAGVETLEAISVVAAYNALVTVLITAGTAEVVVGAYDAPKIRRPGVLSAGTIRSRLTAGALRGP